MKVVLISDIGGLALMRARPEPAWRVRFSALRNKELLAPDYGLMHVAAHLKASGRSFEVINVVADVHRDAEHFIEPLSDPGAMTGSPIARESCGTDSARHLFSELERLSPDVILAPLSNYGLALQVKEVLHEVKERCPGASLVAGGIYSTMHAGEMLAGGCADFVVRGEGEVACAELLDSIESGGGASGVPGVSSRSGEAILHNDARPFISDLDSLANLYTVSEEFDVASRFLLLRTANPWDDYIPGAGFLTSRGCPEACRFCLDPTINRGRVRFHSPAYVREVVSLCSERFGGERFFFGDATFTVNRKRLRELLSELDGLPYHYQIQTRADYLDKGVIELLASCRFDIVAIGAESLNAEVLQKAAGKRLEPETTLDAALSVARHGMKPLLTFIVGLPGETRDSILETVEILRENGLTSATFVPLVVFKGTAIYDDFCAMYSPDDREALRVSPVSEEFLFAGGEFKTGDELKRFADEVNAMLAD